MPPKAPITDAHLSNKRWEETNKNFIKKIFILNGNNTSIFETSIRNVRID